MTADRLAEIEQRVQAATPGHWSAADEHGDIPDSAPAWCISILRDPNDGGPDSYLYDIAEVFGKNEVADAELIAHAPSDLAWQAQRIRELEAREARVRELHKSDDDPGDEWCWNCQVPYPCPTIRALDGES